MSLSSYSNVAYRRQEVPKESNSLVDLLAGLLIFGISVAIVLLGIVADDSLLYGLGIAFMATTLAYNIVKLVAEIRDFIWGFKDRQVKNQN